MVALLASLTPMCLVVWRGVTGDAVHILEIVGVLLAMAGGVVSTVGEGGGDDGADAGEKEQEAIFLSFDLFFCRRRRKLQGRCSCRIFILQYAVLL